MLTHDYLKAAPNFTITDAVANHWQYVIITTKQRIARTFHLSFHWNLKLTLHYLN